MPREGRLTAVPRALSPYTTLTRPTSPQAHTYRRGLLALVLCSAMHRAALPCALPIQIQKRHAFTLSRIHLWHRAEQQNV